MTDGSTPACPSCGEPLPAAAAVTSEVEDPKQLLGRIVNGKYEILSILGEGGMGVVYKVRHLILQNRNTFALKILHPKLCAQPDFHSRFLREVEIAMDLTHENIIQIRDFGLTEQNLLFYTMDFFPGESLKDLIEREKALAPERAARIAREILLALAEAHKSGIIHRDLKPENVLVQKAEDGSDSVRILDFGIAKVLVGDDASTERNLTQGAVIGTPKYMSPEQASGERIDMRSDLYSLGCILFELLTGRPPFDGKTARSILVAHLTTPPPPLEKIRTGLQVPAHLERLVYALLAKAREERPPRAEVVLEILDGKDSEATRPLLATRETAAAPGARKRWLVPGVIAAAVVLVGLVAVLALSLRAGKADAARSEEVPVAVPAPVAAPSEPREEPRRPVNLRCSVCGATYSRGAKVGDMCHGEPLVEVDRP